MKTIIVVDDEEKFAERLAERLQLRGFDTVTAYDGNSALSLLKATRFDSMILDLRLPDIDGTKVLQKTIADFPDIQVIILSGHANEQDFKRCLALGAAACFQKPANIKMLIESLRKKSTLAPPDET